MSCKAPAAGVSSTNPMRWATFAADRPCRETAKEGREKQSKETGAAYQTMYGRYTGDNDYAGTT